MMKKLFFVAIASLAMASCTTTEKTARTETIPYAMYNASVADLDVAPERVTYTLTPSKEIRKGGLSNCKKAAIQECLNKNGNADLLVEPMFVISKRQLLFGSTKITSVTVSGRPAKYKNFRSLPDNVFSDPVFRNAKTQVNYFINKPEDKK